MNDVCRLNDLTLKYAIEAIGDTVDEQVTNAILVFDYYNTPTHVQISVFDCFPVRQRRHRLHYGGIQGIVNVLRIIQNVMGWHGRATLGRIQRVSIIDQH